MKVIIFTEGGKHTGFGHISRCSSLYDELCRRGVEVKFIIQSDIDLAEVLYNREYMVANWISIDYLKSIIQSEDYCIVDSYVAPKSIYQFISENSKKTFYLDDTNRINYPKGVIIRPSLEQSKINESILTGAEYIILRETFKGSISTLTKQNVTEVLVTVGGTIQKELIEKILNQICVKYHQIIFHVIVGNLIDSFLKSNWSNLSQIKFYGYLTSEEIKTLMLRSNFAITAAGQTIYELIATATPFIPIQIAGNQEGNMLSLKERGLATSFIKWGEPEFENRLLNEFEHILDLEFRTQLTKKLLHIIDGNGAKRIINALLNSMPRNNKHETFYLREAQIEDSYSVFQLSNEAHVRKHSINQSTIFWNSHKAWFEKVLKSENYLFLIVTDSSNQVLGQIRYEMTGITATISISLSKELIGKGLSRNLIQQSIKLLRQKYGTLKQVVAFISNENIPSQRVFEKIGFKLITSKKDEKNLLEYIYII